MPQIQSHYDRHQSDVEVEEGFWIAERKYLGNPWQWWVYTGLCVGWASILNVFLIYHHLSIISGK